MKLHTLIVDSFLDDFTSLEKHARTRDYTGITNPFDGVFYPDISVDVPREVALEVAQKIADIMDGSISIRSAFFRLSKSGTHAPHQAHTDLVMGQYGLMIYLQDGDASSGTAILRHKSGQLDSHPVTPEQEALWRQDTNNPDAWEVVSRCPMKANRAFFIAGDVFHRAEPIGGFGTTKEDGRIVFTVFFDSTQGSVYAHPLSNN